MSQTKSVGGGGGEKGGVSLCRAGAGTGTRLRLNLRILVNLPSGKNSFRGIDIQRSNYRYRYGTI